MSNLNDKALKSISGLDDADTNYCLELASRLGNMGIDGKTISQAVTDLVAKDAVPTFIPTAATPSLFALSKDNQMEDINFELETVAA